MILSKGLSWCVCVGVGVCVGVCVHVHVCCFPYTGESQHNAKIHNRWSWAIHAL